MKASHLVAGVAALISIACGAAPPAAPAPSGTSTPVATPELPTDPNCPERAPSADARCVQDCGPPVARDGEPPPPYRWLEAAEAERRSQYGCPRCLDASTTIATPDGERRLDTLVVGDLVYTMDAAGHRVVAPLLRIQRTPAPSSHRVLVFELADGRMLRASAGHPTPDGRRLGSIDVGATLDGSFVIRRSLAAPFGGATWDLLPAGATGIYWASGVALASTLKQR